MLFSIVAAALIVLALLPALSTAYLLFLTAAAVARKLGSRRRDVPGPETRFGVLVPAHNEEALIGRLLDNLARLDYPPALLDVWVVADNCSDATASIARAAGAKVMERVSATDRAKGFALRWLLARLTERGMHYDAYVVLDADSIVAPNFLLSMDAHLRAGSKVVQAYYSVLNPGASALAGLRYLALAALHYLRPMGRSALRLSVGLKGNGMCFAAGVLQEFGWNWFTLAEDVEFHLALVKAGYRVDFASDTCVLADMPVTFDQANSQNQRWERGRIDMLRAQVPGLLGAALKKRNILALDAAVEQLLPPLSLPIAVGGLCGALGVILNVPLAALLGGVSVAGMITYLLAGALLAGAPAGVYRSLAYAPIYVGWKVGLYAMTLLGPRTQAWVRTTRVSGAR